MRTLSRNAFAKADRLPPTLLLRNGGPASWPGRPKDAYYDRDGLFDTFSVAPGAAFPQITQMFQVPVGTNGKTKAQTNMQMAGMMANGDAFLVTGIRCELAFNSFPVDALNILQLCYLSVQFYNREFLWNTMSFFPAGGGGCLTAAANLGAASTVPSSIVSGITNGTPEIHNSFEFNDPLILEMNDRVEIDFVNPTAFTMTTAANGGVGTTIKVTLDGTRMRRTS